MLDKSAVDFFSGCPAGDGIGEDGETCSECGLGTYSANFGSETCQSCPGGQTTENTGSDAATQCGTYTF